MAVFVPATTPSSMSSGPSDGGRQYIASLQSGAGATASLAQGDSTRFRYYISSDPPIPPGAVGLRATPHPFHCRALRHARTQDYEPGSRREEVGWASGNGAVGAPESGGAGLAAIRAQRGCWPALTCGPGWPMCVCGALRAARYHRRLRDLTPRIATHPRDRAHDARVRHSPRCPLYRGSGWRWSRSQMAGEIPHSTTYRTAWASPIGSFGPLRPSVGAVDSPLPPWSGPRNLAGASPPLGEEWTIASCTMPPPWSWAGCWMRSAGDFDL